MPGTFKTFCKNSDMDFLSYSDLRPNVIIPFHGGSEYGQFIIFGYHKQETTENFNLENFKYLGIKQGDIILEIEGQNICGFRTKDVVDLLQFINKDKGNLIIKYVEQESGFPHDLHMFLCQRFAKGTQEHMLQQQIRENLYLRTVPCTTRIPKPGEINGVDYIFLTFDEFCQLQRSGQLIEYGVYEGNLYGTPRPDSSLDVVNRVNLQPRFDLAAPDTLLELQLSPATATKIREDRSYETNGPSSNSTARRGQIGVSNILEDLENSSKLQSNDDTDNNVDTQTTSNLPSPTFDTILKIEIPAPPKPHPSINHLNVTDACQSFTPQTGRHKCQSPIKSITSSPPLNSRYSPKVDEKTFSICVSPTTPTLSINPVITTSFLPPSLKQSATLSEPHKKAIDPSLNSDNNQINYQDKGTLEPDNLLTGKNLPRRDTASASPTESAAETLNSLNSLNSLDTSDTSLLASSSSSTNRKENQSILPTDRDTAFTNTSQNDTEKGDLKQNNCTQKNVPPTHIGKTRGNVSPNGILNSNTKQICPSFSGDDNPKLPSEDSNNKSLDSRRASFQRQNATSTPSNNSSIDGDQFETKARPDEKQHLQIRPHQKASATKTHYYSADESAYEDGTGPETALIYQPLTIGHQPNSLSKITLTTLTDDNNNNNNYTNGCKSYSPQHWKSEGNLELPNKFDNGTISFNNSNYYSSSEENSSNNGRANYSNLNANNSDSSSTAIKNSLVRIRDINNNYDKIFDINHSSNIVTMNGYNSENQSQTRYSTLKANHYKTFIENSIGLRFTKNPQDLTNPSSSAPNSNNGFSTTTLNNGAGKLLGFHLTKSDRGFGFTILGHSERDRDFLFVNKILPGGPASKDGNLLRGDILVYVNTICVLGYSHNDILQLLKTVPAGETIQIIVCRGSGYNESFFQTRLQLELAQKQFLAHVTATKSNEKINLTSKHLDNINNHHHPLANGQIINSQRAAKQHEFSSKTLPHKFKFNPLISTHQRKSAKQVPNGHPKHHVPNSKSNPMEYQENGFESNASKPVVTQRLQRKGVFGLVTLPIYEDLKKLRIFGNIPNPNSTNSATTNNSKLGSSTRTVTDTKENLQFCQNSISNQSVSVRRNSDDNYADRRNNYAISNSNTTSLNSHTPLKLTQSKSNGYLQSKVHQQDTANSRQNVFSNWNYSHDSIKMNGHVIFNDIKGDNPNVNGYANGHLPYDGDLQRKASPQIINCSISRKSLREGFGFIILSSMDGKSGSFINKIIAGSPAQRCPQLRIGQKILAINGIDVRSRYDSSPKINAGNHTTESDLPEGHFTHQQIVELIKRSGLSLQLRLQDLPNSPSIANGKLKQESSAEELNGSYDVQKSFNEFASQIKKQSTFKDSSSVAPFLTSTQLGEMPGFQSQPHILQNGYLKQQQNMQPSIKINDNIVGKTKRTIDEEKQPQILSIELYKGTRGFGFSIRGGSEFQSMPLYVYGIAEDGPAHKDGRLRVGDEILEINGKPTAGMSHSEALDVIKSWEHLVRLAIKRWPTPKPNMAVNGHLIDMNNNVNENTYNSTNFGHYYSPNDYASCNGNANYSNYNEVTTSSKLINQNNGPNITYKKINNLTQTPASAVYYDGYSTKFYPSLKYGQEENDVFGISNNDYFNINHKNTNNSNNGTYNYKASNSAQNGLLLNGSSDPPPSFSYLNGY